ncbi:MAG: hypothetical protein IJI83_02930 [Oscillospiraceae bacterium]|nr:hypothetical protein [Oscillospiraceae bacterium]
MHRCHPGTGTGVFRSQPVHHDRTAGTGTAQQQKTGTGRPGMDLQKKTDPDIGNDETEPAAKKRPDRTSMWTYADKNAQIHIGKLDR